MFVALVTNASDSYDVYDFYANIVTLKIKVLCSRTVLPPDPQSSTIDKHNNMHYNLFVVLVINPSDLYDAYGFYANIATLKINVLCSRTSLPPDP